MGIIFSVLVIIGIISLIAKFIGDESKTRGLNEFEKFDIFNKFNKK